MIRLKKIKRNGMRKFTYLGCVMTRDYSNQCRGLCEPIAGEGSCGRIAPHAMTSRIQEAIRNSRS